ncbi:MAG TPA: nucleotide sugar dehydrogenase, partial [Thermoanaerobaculia bacterium]|nr:nucleotide sugar dehydrogenase [Thermoanaerobaculia bacterium]
LDSDVIDGLQNGKPPLFEPGLEELVRAGLDRGTLRFTTDVASVRDAEIVWVTYDTPVDEDDHADVEFVVRRVESLFEHLANGTLVVVSSQLPVGSVRRLETAYAQLGRAERVSFACSPENLRLGKAIDAFLKPDRVVCGVRSDSDRAKLTAALAPITSTIEWMSVESAEMTKHALNAFLATSVAFINEIAVICEAAGADAKEVERGLKSDPRIGTRAYLSPGGAFAGGTLARDIAFLSAMRPLPLLTSVKRSNDQHKSWAREKLSSVLSPLRGRKIGVWGLTYKPGTDTLRRSSSVELCRWLASEDAEVRAFDPAVKKLPEDLAAIMRLDASASDTVRDADAIVIATEWPEFRALAAETLTRDGLVIVDANRFVAAAVAPHAGVRYYTVGK